LRSISVVIPLWNELDLTRECVRGLSEARAKHGTPHELILVDNGSTDETGDWVEAQQNASDWIRARRLPENLGFAGGCNAGLELATGEYVCFLNNDTLLPMALFERLMSATLRAPNVGLVAPVSNYVKGRQLLEIFADESADDVEQIQARLDAQSARVVEDSPQVAGLCVLLRRELMQEIGGFDERYGLGNYEDDDLCLNIRSRDLRILIARDAYLFHHGNRTFRALGVDYEEQLKSNKELYESKWRDCELFELERAIERQDASAAKRILSNAQIERSHGIRRAEALCAELEGDFAVAAELWLDYLRVCPSDSEAHIHQALCLIRDGHEAAGRHALAVAIGTHCHDSLSAASAMTQLAEHELKSGQLALARDDLADALQLRPDFVPAINLGGVIALETSDYDACIQLIEPWLHKDDEALHANIGIAYFHTGRHDEALRAFERGSELGGEDSASHRNLVQLRAHLAGG
jgi:GT2 family glycosyltransferase